MLTGKILRFDEVRGYGFIDPDAGGDDVFIHANVLECEKSALGPGVAVRYEAVDSDRGPKATTVQVLRSGSAEPRQPAVAQVRSTNGSGNGSGSSGAAFGTGAGFSSAPAHAQRSGSSAEDEDAMCDVLSERALIAEITESLLTTVGDLSAAQVVAVRSLVLATARRHGWVEG